VKGEGRKCSADGLSDVDAGRINIAGRAGWALAAFFRGNKDDGLGSRSSMTVGVRALGSASSATA
jgi:hypothetical protein